MTDKNGNTIFDILGWLEPLLYRLKQNPKACLSPNVGLLKRDTFGVDFTTRWTFQRFPMFVFTLEEAHSFYKPDYLAKINRSEPLPTGINQGMVIAMKKSWFKQLGGFDTGMRVWGGEQIELSVKVWTCGGAVEIIPCSYIAHLFKTRLVWENMGLSKIINALRFAEVWMDEYKEMLHQYWPTARREIDLGPGLRERKVIRRQNRCKPFQYYIDKVKEFGLVHFPENLRSYGWVRNILKETRYLKLKRLRFSLYIARLISHSILHFLVETSHEHKMIEGYVK